MAKEFSRSQRVAQQIQRTLAMYLEKNRLADVAGLITISSTSVSPDLKNARVFVTVLGDDTAIESVVEQLNANTAVYQAYLANSLKLRVTPRLHFEYDKVLARANRITDLIDHLDHPAE
ncbi:MAG: 30S ribosome-binding factor RbfA [Thiotrichales bacterium]|nr:30S ribosome-binding factor RbfA [Thiotrichales bacterium]